MSSRAELPANGAELWRGSEQGYKQGREETNLIYVQGHTPKLLYHTGYTTMIPSQLQAPRIKSPKIRLAPLITVDLLTTLQDWAGAGTRWPAGPVTGRARADEAVLATLQRNVGSLRSRPTVCCERPGGVPGLSCAKVHEKG